MSVINLQKCYADTSVIELAFNFKATYWLDLKVDAIEPLSDFYWIEDSPIPEELVWLRQNGVLDRQIRVDSRNGLPDLRKIITTLEQKFANEIGK